MSPEEMGLKTEKHKCLYNMLRQLKQQQPLPPCTTEDYVTTTLPELNIRAKFFRDKWFECVEHWPEPIPDAQSLFDQGQQLGCMHNSLDFLFARGATEWEIERAAFGVRSCQRNDNVPPVE